MLTQSKKAFVCVCVFDVRPNHHSGLSIGTESQINYGMGLANYGTELKVLLVVSST